MLQPAKLSFDPVKSWSRMVPGKADLAWEGRSGRVCSAALGSFPAWAILNGIVVVMETRLVRVLLNKQMRRRELLELVYRAERLVAKGVMRKRAFT